MSNPKIYEATLFTSNRPLPKKPIPPGSPVGRVSGQFVDDDPMAPWDLWALAPIELVRQWEPLAPGTECVWLTRNQKARMALVDYRTNRVLAWRPASAADAYRPRPRRSRR